MDYLNDKTVDGNLFEILVESGAAKLNENLQTVNDLNVFPIPDGDTGDNMFRTLSGGIFPMRQVTENSLFKKAKALSDGMLMNARGNSGVILSRIFCGIAESLDGVEVGTMRDFSKALIAGYKKGYGSVVNPVEGTILTVARESAEKVNSSVTIDSTLKDVFDLLVKEISVSLENTPELLAVLKEAGVVDSGGAGLMYIAEGARGAVYGKTFGEAMSDSTATNKNIDFSKFNEDSVMEFGYCTEFLLQLQNAKVDIKAFDVQTIIDYLKTIGDSIVAFMTGSVVKVHVHTMQPYKALEFCQQFGEFLTVKIENMTLQHNETLKDEDEFVVDLPKVKKARKKFGLCSVANGRGIIDLFKELGADEIIDGGMGKNPSVSDFIDAFDNVNADNIFVLPNNSNIFLAAQEAAKLYDKSKVYVIPTKDIGQAYSALSMLDYSADDADAIADQLAADMADVTTGYVAKAIRDANLDGVTISLDGYVGAQGKTVLAAASSKVGTLTTLLEKMGFAEKTFLTLFYGRDVTDEEKTLANELLAETYPDAEIYEIDGDQEVFDVIVVME